MPKMIADVIKDAIATADDHLKIAQEMLAVAQNALEMLRAGDGNRLIDTITYKVTEAMTDDKNPEGQKLENPPAFGSTGFWIGLSLFMSLIALALYLRRRNIDAACGGIISKFLHKMENCFCTAYARYCSSAKFLRCKTVAFCSMVLVVSLAAAYYASGLTGVWTGLILFMILIATAGFLRLPVKIGHWEINKEKMMTMLQQLLNLIKSHQINEEKVRKEIKASIEKFRSMKERLKLMKLQKINKNDVKDIKAAIKTVRSIDEDLKLMKSQKFNEEDEKQIQAALKPAIVAAQKMEEIINNGVWLLGHV